MIIMYLSLLFVHDLFLDHRQLGTSLAKSWIECFKVMLNEIKFSIFGAPIVIMALPYPKKKNLLSWLAY